MGQHHRGAGADPAHRRSGEGTARRPEDLAHALALRCCSTPERGEVRQDRGGQVRLARPRADDAVRVLPVLAGPAETEIGQLPRFFTLLDRPAIEARAEQAARRRSGRRSGRWRSTSRPASTGSGGTGGRAAVAQVFSGGSEPRRGGAREAIAERPPATLRAASPTWPWRWRGWAACRTGRRDGSSPRAGSTSTTTGRRAG